MIGTIIQGYQILSEINRGGMSKVYLAKHIRMEKMFAIKNN
jgi:serine/threonine protein kinase